MNMFYKSLSVRLFFILMGTIILIFGFYIYRSIKITSSNLFLTSYGYLYSNAEGAGELIHSSIRYGMFLNERKEVNETLRNLSGQEAIVGIDIYNKEGIIKYSIDSLKTGKQVDKQADVCIICHISEVPKLSFPGRSKLRILEDSENNRLLRMIRPIENESSCSTAPCHVHQPDQKILGVLDVRMSLDSVDKLNSAARNDLLYSAILMAVLVSTVSAIFIYRVVQKPIRGLMQGMNRIASGDLTTRLESRSKTEIGELARCFNKMADDLSTARNEVNDWAMNLEDRIKKKSKELENVQDQMIQMEKMASLGKLSASVAHEINNPLFGILTYAKLSLRELETESFNEKTKESIMNHLSIIQRESNRCGDIVKNLLNFSKPGGGDFSPHRINEELEKMLLFLEPHLRKHRVTTETKFTKEKDEIKCDPNQCQQALLALCINALESMPAGGKLTIETRRDGGNISILIGDTGVGIPESIIPRIFEPFYSTKKDTSGSSGLGLGLSIVYGIVQNHGGEITVESSPGEGSTFCITLPLDQNNSEAALEDPEDS